MSEDKSAISTLLWALKEAGIEYDSPSRSFSIHCPKRGKVTFKNPVDAAKDLAAIHQRNSLMVESVYPTLLQKQTAGVKAWMENIRPSKLPQQKKALEEILDETEASLLRARPGG